MSEYKQELHLYDRSLLKLNGVKHVDSFDAAAGVYLTTNMGDLAVEGEDLHIAHLDLDAGEIVVRGQIKSLEYREPKDQRSAGEKSKSFIKRLMK